MLKILQYFTHKKENNLLDVIVIIIIVNLAFVNFLLAIVVLFTRPYILLQIERLTYYLERKKDDNS